MTATAKPTVRLAEVVDGSIAPTVFAIIDRGAMLRPQLAAQMRGSVLLCFDGVHPSVRIDFAGDSITIGDGAGATDRAVDLRIDAALGDIVALIAAPLAGGLPRPTSRKGRAALARIADGRVDLDGPLSLGRKLLRLMSVVCVALALGGCGGSGSDDAVEGATAWFGALKSSEFDRACDLQLPLTARNIRSKFLPGKRLTSCPDVMKAYRARLSDKLLDAIDESGFEAEGDIKKGLLGVFPVAKDYEIGLVLMKEGDPWKVAGVAIAPDQP